MGDCIDLLRNIGMCCNASSVGGVNKRLWVTQISQIYSFTFDSNGYLDSLVLKPYQTLSRLVGQKFSHSGSCDLQVDEDGDAPFYSQTVSLKLYPTTPIQETKLQTIASAKRLVFFLETESGKIKIYGLNYGLECNSMSDNTGVNLSDDNGVSISFSGNDLARPHFMLINASLNDTINYLDGISSEEEDACDYVIYVLADEFDSGLENEFSEILQSE